MTRSDHSLHNWHAIILSTLGTNFSQTKTLNTQTPTTSFRTDSFIHVLIGDVVAAFEELESDDTPMRRRSAIRTAFSSVEGLMSVARKSLKVLPLTPAEIAIVQEVSYEVNERGTISERSRYIPFDRNLKATVQIVRRVRPDYSLDYDHPGWPALKRTLNVRHRLTHPKALEDLTISDEEIEDVHRGFLWFLAFVIEVMEETVDDIKETYSELIRENEHLSEVIRDLGDGEKSGEETVQ